jgi:hypothetical protein
MTPVLRAPSKCGGKLRMRKNRCGSPAVIAPAFLTVETALSRAAVRGRSREKRAPEQARAGASLKARNSAHQQAFLLLADASGCHLRATCTQSGRSRQFHAVTPIAAIRERSRERPHGLHRPNLLGSGGVLSINGRLSNLTSLTPPTRRDGPNDCCLSLSNQRAADRAPGRELPVSSSWAGAQELAADVLARA